MYAIRSFLTQLFLFALLGFCAIVGLLVAAFSIAAYTVLIGVRYAPAVFTGSTLMLIIFAIIR